jgi:hypothetical protein
MQAEFGMPFFRVWQPIVRWVIPIAIGVILVLGVWEKMHEAGFGMAIESALTTTD